MGARNLSQMHSIYMIRFSGVGSKPSLFVTFVQDGVAVQAGARARSFCPTVLKLHTEIVPGLGHAIKKDRGQYLSSEKSCRCPTPDDFRFFFLKFLIKSRISL